MNSKYFKHVNYCFEGFPLILVSTQKVISEGVLGNVAKAAIGTGLTVGTGLALANPEGFSGVLDSAKTAGQGALNSIKSFGQNAYNTASGWFSDTPNASSTSTSSSIQPSQTPANTNTNTNTNTNNQSTQSNPGTNKVVSQPSQAQANTGTQSTQSNPGTNKVVSQQTQAKPPESFTDTAQKVAVTGGTMLAAGGVANGAKQAINATTNIMNRPQQNKQQSNQQQTQRVVYA